MYFVWRNWAGPVNTAHPADPEAEQDRQMEQGRHCFAYGGLGQSWRPWSPEGLRPCKTAKYPKAANILHMAVLIELGGLAEISQTAASIQLSSFGDDATPNNSTASSPGRRYLVVE
jgi:hypothetical protein